MLNAYWEIGRMIVEEEQNGKDRADYGKYLIKNLSVQLKQEFGKGFEERNLWFFKSFFLSFPILNALRSELTWTHYRLLTRVNNEKAKEFYINEAITGDWSTRTLERNINSFYYERLLSSKNNKEVTERQNNTKEPINHKDFIKDPYVLEFLNIPEMNYYLERDLESGLIEKLQKFLLELGKGFAFVARQQRISTETSHFYIDLVFYHYLLKCFVLIDLKVGKLTHQDIGQMDMYVRMYEDKMKNQGDNPTIGIILCSEKEEAVVKYSVLKDNERLFASTYKLYLPTEEELKAELEREVSILKEQQAEYQIKRNF